MPKSSPIGDYQPSPQQTKELGVEVVSKGDAMSKKKYYLPLFFPSQFQPPATWSLLLIN